MKLETLPPKYSDTRDALRALACFVISPARKAQDGRIGLRATGDGFGTPVFGERARRVLVRGAQLVVEEGGRVVERAPITTVRAAAERAGVVLSEDPGVGRDLPVFEPDRELAVDVSSSNALGQWYALVDMVLVDLRESLAVRGRSSEINLWPEHFDLAFDFGPDAERRVNLGGSPGDASSAEPYLYVGPWERDSFNCDRYWNTEFGAALPYSAVIDAPDAKAAMLGFLTDGISRLGL